MFSSPYTHSPGPEGIHHSAHVVWVHFKTQMPGRCWGKSRQLFQESASGIAVGLILCTCTYMYIPVRYCNRMPHMVVRMGMTSTRPKACKRHENNMQHSPSKSALPTTRQHHVLHMFHGIACTAAIGIDAAMVQIWMGKCVRVQVTARRRGRVFYSTCQVCKQYFCFLHHSIADLCEPVPYQSIDSDSGVVAPTVP